jgi:hypothetical protein
MAEMRLHLVNAIYQISSPFTRSREEDDGRWYFEFFCIEASKISN